MAEFISIPLRHIQNLIDEIAPSWVYNRLQELKSMLIQIQKGEDCRLLQNPRIDDQSRYLQKINDIRDLAYHIDDQLDTISSDIELCRRWTIPNIPSVIKALALACPKSRVLHNVRSLINLVQKGKFLRHQNSDIREWNEEKIELQRVRPLLHHDHNNFSNDFEGRTSINIGNSFRIVANLIDKNSDETIMNIDLSRNYEYVKEIYDIIHIRKYFQTVAWVSVVKNSKRIIIYRDILNQLHSYDKKNDVVGLMSMEEYELLKELMEVLTSYKCLIFLAFDHSIDDQNLINQFKVPMRSRVLVITHMEDMKCQFPSSYGWEILESITFQNHQKEYSNFGELKEIGLKLLKEYNIVPQQVIRIGGILREDVSTQHWEIVQRSLISYRIDAHHDWKIVALSYDRLCIHLKACFLYFGHFWKGDDISTEMLYQMWMAEGIVSSHLSVGEGKKTTMDIAEEYLAIFARNLLIDVQKSEFSTTRRFVLCRIDNFVKKFCLQPENMNTTEVFEPVKDTSFGFKSSSQDGRRLSLKFNISAHVDEVTNTLNLASKKLRSLLIQKENGIPRIKISFPIVIFKMFKLLRVLKIENFEILDGKLPKDIRTLIHLRFLSLEGSTFEELPKTLGKFQFMQTLDLRVAEIIPRGIIVPNVLCKLKELRHLYLPTCHQLPKGKYNKLFLNGLDKLETLANFDIEKVELTSLEWKSLRYIDVTVHGKKSTCDVIDCINKCGGKLKETFLRVSFSGFSHEESEVPLEEVFNCSKLNHFMVNWGRCDLNEFKIPSDSFSSNLIELCLIRCQIREDPMSILGNFPQLRKLVLGKETFMGTCMTFQFESFPNLRYLKIKGIKYLEELKIGYRTMRNLFCLEIICCFRLKMIPSGLMFLCNMGELKLRMPKKFNDRIRTQDGKKGEDVEKVKHVPFIFLEDR